MQFTHNVFGDSARIFTGRAVSHVFFLELRGLWQNLALPGKEGAAYVVQGAIQPGLFLIINVKKNFKS